MTLAMIGAILLLFGSIRVFAWLAQRLITRQERYESTRVQAGSSQSNLPVEWNEPSQRLSILNR